MLASLQDDLKEREYARPEIHGPKVVLIGDQSQIAQARNFLEDFFTENAPQEMSKSFKSRVDFQKLYFNANGEKTTVRNLLTKKFPEVKIFVQVSNEKFPFFKTELSQTVKVSGSKHDCEECLREVDTILGSLKIVPLQSP